MARPDSEDPRANDGPDGAFAGASLEAGDASDFADLDDDDAALLRAVAHAPDVPLSALAPTLAPGARIGEFEILGTLGAGGMGVVYRARDTRLDREVALKLLHPSWESQGEGGDALLEREARATARLRHPNLVTIHAVGRHEGGVYLVLELLRGETLATRLTRGPLDPAAAAATMLAVAEALAHAHGQGIVHRDLKPGNVFLEAGATGEVVKLLDFGLSGATEGRGLAAGSTAAFPARTILGAGTPGYMAPEQWRGEPADARTDVFAAGVLLDELCTGSRPPSTLAAATLPRRSPRERGLDCPPALDRVIARATAPRREDRFPDAAAFAEALRDFQRRARGRRTRRALLVGLAVAAVGGGIAAAVLWPRALPDLSGAWQAEPASWGKATLVRVGDGRYRWEHKSRETPVDNAFCNRGELQVVERHGRHLLAGKLADAPGWCCGNFGYMELEIIGADELHVNVSMWGAREGDYTNVMPAYYFRRVGPPPK